MPNPLSGDNPPHFLVSRAKPFPGESFQDSAFGTRLTRVTSKAGVRHEYSRFDAFNKDKSMILLVFPATGEWKVFRTNAVPYDADSNLVTTLASLEEPRWDPQDPNILWGSREFSVIALNVSNGEETIVKDFSSDEVIGPIIRNEPDLYHITMNSEGESSLDKRFWAFFLQGTADDYRPRYAFTWDKELDAVEGVYKISPEEADIDWIGMSPFGNYVLIGGLDSNGGNLSGLTMADRKLSRFHKLDSATAHADVGVDVEGREVIVMQDTKTDYVDLIPISWTTTPVDDTGNYEGTGRTPLVRLYYDSASDHGLSSGIHVSCNAPGYCVISTHMEPNTPEKNWLDGSIVLVKLNATMPQAFYVAKVGGACADYWEETHATISSDGKKILWATNWNEGVGAENAASVFEVEASIC